MPNERMRWEISHGLRGLNGLKQGNLEFLALNPFNPRNPRLICSRWAKLLVLDSCECAQSRFGFEFAEALPIPVHALVLEICEVSVFRGE